jgi:CheY-like chemotaxis protein
MRPFRIAVVDDNHLIRRLVALVLESEGHVVVGAESGEAALEVARESPFDLWIIDEMMPRMRGSELIRLLRRSLDPRVAEVPIVGVSGRAGAARDLLVAGATTFVPKPIDERVLLEEVARTLATAAHPHADSP